jgi:hypothetical protein
MADIANLVLAVDATQVKSGTAALDGLTAAGTRAQAAAVGLGSGVKGAGAEATAMAAAAQASARAAANLTTNFTASANAAKLNTIAMRETLVVARELSRGNFTRIPGSLTLLAQGISSQGGGISGFLSSLTKTLGLVKTLQNAELAEEAANAAAAAGAVQAAAQRAQANIAAADTELALAEAQARLTEGTSAAAAAEVRLAEARQARAAASSEAAIAEDALAVAAARAEEASAASAATTTTALTGLGAAFGIVTAAAGFALAGFEGFKSEVKDSGALDQFAESLRLTKSQIEEAGGSVKYLSHNVEEVTGLTVTWGDVAKGTFNAVAEAAGVSSSQFHHFWTDAFLQVAQVGVSAAQVIAGAFAAVASIANNLKGVALGIVNPSLAGVAGAPNPLKVGEDAMSALKKQFGDVGKFFHETLPNSIVDAAKSRLQKLSDSDNPKAPKKPKKPRAAPTDEFDDLSARLDEQILSAKKSLAGSIEDQAKFALQEVDVQTKKTIEDAQQLLKKKRLTLGEEQHIELQARELDALKKQIILRDEATKLLTQQQAAQDQLYAFATDALKSADELATTQADHRKIQLDMLDIAYQQKAYDLQILEAKQKLAGDLAATAQTQAFIDLLPGQKFAAQAVVMKNTQDPLSKWVAEVPHDAKTITEALQGIEVHGFDALASSIAGVISGTESLGQAFKDISQQIIGDLIQVIVKMLVVRALTAAMGGGSKTLMIDTPLGYAKGGVFSGGNVIPFALGGVVSGPSMFPMSGGRTGLMGEAGPEAVMPLTRDSQGRLGVRAANSNPVVEVHIVRGEMFEPVVRQVAGEVSVKIVNAAAPEIARGAAEGVLKGTSRPKLMGRG